MAKAQRDDQHLAAQLHRLMPLCEILGIEASSLADPAEVVVTMAWKPNCARPVVCYTAVP
jgi:hypothetical protein